MFETSKDLLYLVIAFCILWLTIFMCWLMYYFIMIFKNMHEMVKGFKSRLEMIDGVIKSLKEKIEHSATYLGLLVEGVGKLVEYLKEKKVKKNSRRENKENIE